MILDILVVEDDLRKSEEIRQEIIKVVGIEGSKITVVRDARSARECLTSASFHLVILDLRLPVLDGDMPTDTGGLTLLKGLQERKGIRLPLHIVGLTAFDSAFEGSVAEFDRRLWGLLKYSEGAHGWRKQLRSKIEYLVTALRTSSLEPQYASDVAIICALRDLELGAVLDLPYEWQKVTPPGDATEYHLGSVNGNGRPIQVIAAACSNMGMPAAAALAAKAIDRFRPRYVICAGITAGVSSEVEIGDVLIAESSWDYGSGKYEIIKRVRRFIPDPRPVSLDGAIADKFQALSADRNVLEEIRSRWNGEKPKHSLSLKVGPLPSGAAVVADPHILKDLRQRSRKIIGLDMEGFGVYYAADHSSFPQPIPILIKSVSDFADTRKSSSKKYRPYAAYTSAAVVDFAIRKMLGFQS